MVTYACDVAATTARTGVPALIAESLAAGRVAAAAAAEAAVSDDAIVDAIEAVS
jgi:hypothetical protein